MPGANRRCTGGCWRVGALRYDTLKASPAVHAARALWGGAGLSQRRGRAAHAISPLDSPATCRRRKSSSAGGGGLHLLDERHFDVSPCTCDGGYVQVRSACVGLGGTPAGHATHTQPRAHSLCRDEQVRSSGGNPGFERPIAQMRTGGASPLRARWKRRRRLSMAIISR